MTAVVIDASAGVEIVVSGGGICARRRFDRSVKERGSTGTTSPSLTQSTLPRPTTWVQPYSPTITNPSETFDALLTAQMWVAGQQRRKGLLIGAPETAAHREGLISDDQLRALAEAVDHDGDLAKSGYGQALLRFLEFTD